MVLLSSVEGDGWRTLVLLERPEESPPCQYFCRARNAMMSGMTDTSEPMMITPQRFAPPLLFPEAWPCHRPRPTVIGKSLVLASMARGRK